MRIGSNKKLLFSATDLANFAACERLTALERQAASGDMPRPEVHSAMADLLSSRGDAHEAAYLEKQRRSGLWVLEIPVEAQDEAALRLAEYRTLEAMRSGADVIFQATFFDGQWGGRADFLRKVATPSDLGEWSYEVVDTKLARRTKPEAVLQLCEYSLHVDRLQGVAPRQIHVVLGTGEEESINLSDVVAYYRHLRRRFAVVLERAAEPVYPVPVRHCQVCRWQPSCEALRRGDDHLTLVARMRRDQLEKLNAAGIHSVAELAAAAPDTPVAKLPVLTMLRLQRQAALQVEARRQEKLLYELLPFEIGRGFHLLPEPSPSDVFFDIEGDPLFEGGGLEYLLGVVVEEQGTPRFQAWRAHDRDAEKLAFEQFIDFVIARLDAAPDMHVYHYADYEKAAIKRLMARHGTRELEVDRLLRGETFVDLYAVVRGAIRLGAESYSLKTVEHLYLAARTEEVKDATSSIVEYERWRTTGDAQILVEIERYNEVDCDSTRQLRDWLEVQRGEMIASGNLVPRPDSQESLTTEALRDTAARNVAWGHRLRSDEVGYLSPDQAWLLAQMLDWHQREDRPKWWEHFHRLGLSEEELIDDTTALGGLEYRGVCGQENRSTLHEFGFSPGQEHKLAPDTSVMDPSTRGRFGKVAQVDDRSGRLVIKCTNDMADPPRALAPATGFGSQVLREAVARMVGWVLEHPGAGGGGPFDAGLALLQRRPAKRLFAEEPDTLIRAQKAARALDGEVLPIQGPPGSGKTYVGARLILDLVNSGQRVGITGPSHRAITNLVQEVCSAARDAGKVIRVVQKRDTEERIDEMVQVATSNAAVDAAVADGVDVVAGTPWLFARDVMEQQVATLVVDEAGQVPLANALAVCGAARSMVLLGDPQQLPQPAVGAHPHGASPSTFEHLLHGAATVSGDQGMFLEKTWRMHPEITRVVSELSYENRLISDVSCVRQRVSGDDELGGAGVRFVPVPHNGNRVASDEEATAVAGLVAELLDRQWRDRFGKQHDLTPSDILVVAPFNAHVARLSGVLPDGVRIGSVDRFQGQEAAVVIFSMGTSSADDSPRGLEFVFNLNRLNVALSRGRALSILVASPRLLDAHCHSVAQVKLVNALCRFVEVATSVPLPKMQKSKARP